MEGLEVSEVKLSQAVENKDYRIDSDFWTKMPKKNPLLKYMRIGDILLSAQYGISISMNEDNKGYPIYRMNEIHNMLCDLSVDKCADISANDFQNFELKNRDILFNRTNSFEWVGRTGIYYQNDEIRKTFASYLVRFNPDESIILPEYLVAFLNTKQGVWDIKRRARQSINQTNVNPEEVKEIEIPILSMDFQKKIKNNFEESNKKRIQSQQLYRQAKELLLETIGLKDFQPVQENKNIKSFSESFLTTGRLDAEYYQPKYEEIIAKVEQQEYDLLSNLVSIKKSIEPGSDVYSDEGLPFLRVADYNKLGISKPEKKLSDNFCNDNQVLINGLKPKKNTILFSKDGSVGTAYMLREDADFITSGAILHLTVKSRKVLPEYLTLVLNSEVVQQQAERDAGGSIILHWRMEEIENVVVPIVDDEIQQQIAE
ncbi:MAG: restriction endonuclease subunit S, partial [Dysgonamonadaceae bacterium]|nr:restriction endonuclease subunit S [Dysgonamonadaceae bacterium]